MPFTGIGYQLHDGSPWETHEDTANSTQNNTRVVSLKDLCLSTLDRYIDLLEDIGSTPFYLVESVLRKCNAEQLLRIETHSEVKRQAIDFMAEGLSEYTNELWYQLARSEYRNIREEYPQYEEDQDWRTLYETRTQQEREKFERVGAKLRQSYSQQDKIRQDRRVIVDPSLRLPKRLIRPSSSSWGSSGPKKPKTLFEKARIEARRATLMFSSSQSNTSRSSGNAPGRMHISSVQRRAPVATSSDSRSRHIVAPTSVFAPSAMQATVGSTFSRNDLALAAGNAVSNGPPESPPAAIPGRPKARYSYKVRPVVYTPLVRSAQTQPQSNSPTSPSAKSNTLLRTIAPSAPGAIVDFFKEINPLHADPLSTTSRHSDPEFYLPTSPTGEPSKTIQMLRDSRDVYSRDQDKRTRDKRKQEQRLGVGASKKIKNDGDYSWLENDDDDMDVDIRNNNGADRSLSSAPSSPTKSSKAPMSLEEAGRQFFNQLIGK